MTASYSNLVVFFLVPTSYFCIALLISREKRYGPYRPLRLERLTIMAASMSLIGAFIGLALAGRSVNDEATTRIFVASGVLWMLALVGTGHCLRRGRQSPRQLEEPQSGTLAWGIVSTGLLVLTYFLVKFLV